MHGRLNSPAKPAQTVRENTVHDNTVNRPVGEPAAADRSNFAKDTPRAAPRNTAAGQYWAPKTPYAVDAQVMEGAYRTSVTDMPSGQMDNQSDLPKDNNPPAQTEYQNSPANTDRPQAQSAETARVQSQPGGNPHQPQANPSYHGEERPGLHGDDGYWRCATAHTSGPNSMAEDRKQHPGWWARQ